MHDEDVVAAGVARPGNRLRCGAEVTFAAVVFERVRHWQQPIYAMADAGARVGCEPLAERNCTLSDFARPAQGRLQEYRKYLLV
jgi:hypothetical protein